jgi:hypothetical protein
MHLEFDGRVFRNSRLILTEIMVLETWDKAVGTEN